MTEVPTWPYRAVISSVILLLLGSWGVMFGVEHARAVVNLSMIGFVLSYLIYTLHKTEREHIDNAKAVFILSFSIYRLVKFNHLPSFKLLDLTLLVLSLFCIIYMFLVEGPIGLLQRVRASFSQSLTDTLVALTAIGFFGMFIGILFKVQHWPSSWLPLCAGFLLLIIAFLILLFSSPLKRDF